MKLSPEVLAQEKERFNALTQEEAKSIAAEATAVPPLRSCWYCNGAHERLKDKIFLCFACGLLYVKGYPSPVIAIRVDGGEVTDDDMEKFNQLLERSA